MSKTIPVDPLSLLNDGVTLLGESLFEGLERIRAKGLEGIAADVTEEAEEAAEERSRKKNKKNTTTASKKDSDDDDSSDDENAVEEEEEVTYESIIADVSSKISSATESIHEGANIIAKSLSASLPATNNNNDDDQKTHNKRKYELLSKELVSIHSELQELVSGPGGGRDLLKDITDRLEGTADDSVRRVNEA